MLTINYTAMVMILDYGHSFVFVAQLYMNMFKFQSPYYILLIIRNY